MSDTRKRARGPRYEKRNVVDWPRDNVGVRTHWMMVDNDVVVISAQRFGEAPTGSVQLPRRVFDQFIDWYHDGRWPRPRRVKGRR